MQEVNNLTKNNTKIDELDFPNKLLEKNVSREYLKCLLKNFVNPFILEPDWQGSVNNAFPRKFDGELRGLAIPLYENTLATKYGDIKFQGTYLGWVLLLQHSRVYWEPSQEELRHYYVRKRFPIKPNKDDDITLQKKHWLVLSTMLNYLAASVLTAMSDELVSDYAIHTDQEPFKTQEPFTYLKSRIKDIEGFTTKHSDDSNADDFIEWTPEPDNRIKILNKDTHKLHLWPKKTTHLPTDKKDKEDYQRNNLFPRLQRTLRQLSAIHLNSQTESLRKYKQMMELLSSPLRNLTEALATMQRDTQQLRAILYEPSKTIFESYQRISVLFEEGNTVYISDSIQIVITHNPSYYDDENKTYLNDVPGALPFSVEAGRLCMINLILRIFGFDGISCIMRTNNLNDYMTEAKKILESEKKQEYQRLRQDLLWLWNDVNGTNTSDIQNIIYESSSKLLMKCFLQAIKAVAFSPFKVETTNWNVRALKLTFPVESRTENITIKQNIEELNLKSNSPASYNTILSFLLDIKMSGIFGDPQKCDIVNNNEDEYIIKITYSRSFNSDKMDLNKLKCMMELVLSSPRDWRIQAANQGDFYGPFVHLANQLLGVEYNAKTCDIPASYWVKDPHSQPCDIIALESQNNRYFAVSILKEIIHENIVLEIKWLKTKEALVIVNPPNVECCDSSPLSEPCGDESPHSTNSPIGLNDDQGHKRQQR